jgi:hypothetical protein
MLPRKAQALNSFRAKRCFSSGTRPDLFWAHSASYSTGTGVLSLGVNRPGREINILSPPSAEVKNVWMFGCYVHKNTADKNVVNSLYFYDMFRPIRLAIFRQQYNAHKKENYFCTTENNFLNYVYYNTT